MRPSFGKRAKCTKRGPSDAIWRSGHNFRAGAPIRGGTSVSSLEQIAQKRRRAPTREAKAACDVILRLLEFENETIVLTTAFSGGAW